MCLEACEITSFSSHVFGGIYLVISRESQLISQQDQVSRRQLQSKMTKKSKRWRRQVLSFRYAFGSERKEKRRETLYVTKGEEQGD